MLKMSVLALSLISAFASANNVTISNENIYSSISIGSSISITQSDVFSLDIPSGTKLVNFSSENFEGEKTVYKKGVYLDISLHSFTVENDINTGYSMTFQDFERNSKTCLDVKYTSKHFEDITSATLCNGDTKEVFTAAPQGYREGDYIPFSVWEGNKTILWGQMYVQSTGMLTLSRKPSTIRGVKTTSISPSHLRIGYTQK